MGRVDGLHPLRISRLAIRIITAGLRIFFAPLNDKRVVFGKLRIKRFVLRSGFACYLGARIGDGAGDTVLAGLGTDALLPIVIPPFESEPGDGYTEV